MARPKEYIRVNMRITPEQDKFVKRYAKKNKMLESEVHRLVLASFISDNK